MTTATPAGFPRPGQPFWAWCDIDGRGEKWHLAVLKHDREADDPDGLTIAYPLDDFEDSFDPDDWRTPAKNCAKRIVLIERPYAPRDDE